MLGRYRSILKTGILKNNSPVIYTRFNSNEANSKISEILKKHESSKINETTGNNDQATIFEDLPWDIKKADEIPVDLSDKRNNYDNDNLESDSANDLPWLHNEGDENNIKLEETVDPTDKELILAPLKKKLTPLERLTPRKNLRIKKSNRSNTKKNTDNNAISFNQKQDKVNLQIERDYKNLMQFKYNVSSEDFISVIDELKPSNNVVTVKQLSDLLNNLDKSFRLKQIRQYIETSCPEIKIHKTTPKKKMISKIISEHWGLKVTMDPTGDLVSETRINLSNKRDLFLLFSNKGFLPQHWSLIGAQLTFGNSSKELVIRGSKNIVNFVQASWNDLLNNISTDNIDLNEVIKFYEKLNKNFDIQGLQQETGVYFDKVNFENNNYILSAIKNISINNAKIEILKSADYKYGCNTEVINTIIEDAKNEYPELVRESEISDESLPWNIKPENYFRYAMCKKRTGESLLIDESMIYDSLTKEVMSLKKQVEEAKDKFEYNYVKTGNDNSNNNNSEDLLEFEQSVNDLENLSMKENEEEELVNKMVDELNIANIEQELINPDFQGKEQNQHKLMLGNVVNVKFGKLLYEKNNLKNTYFNDNLSEVVKNLGKLELMDKESSLFGLTGGILNKFTKQVHIKLIPNGFWNNKFSSFVNYPSVEILINLKDGNSLEVNNFSAFISEFEKNMEIGLPYLNVDMKLQSSYNSMLVFNKDQWILNGKKEEEFESNELVNKNILNNKKLINMYITQVSRRKFDLRRTEGLRDMITQFKHKPYQFDINDKTIKYSAVSVEYVKTLELDYEGIPVSFSIRDNGEHESVEVTMLKEDELGLTEFVKKSVGLASFLSK